MADDKRGHDQDERGEERPELDPDSLEEEADAPPKSPYTTETVSFMQGVDDEVLAVVLRGVNVGQRRIGMDIAGPFLFRLNELIHAVASVVAGRAPGARGTLPDVPGAGLLALAGVEWGRSVTFHFGLGQGEELRLGDASTTEQAVAALIELLVSTASEADERLYGITRDLGQRVGVNYVNLVNVLNQHRVDSLWRTQTEERAVDLSVPRIRRAKTVLEREEPPRTLEEEVEGLLYRADSKEHQFILEPIDREEDKIVGVYAPALREEIRDAWDKVVRVRLRTTHRFLARQVEPSGVEVELLGIVETTDGP